MKNILFYVLGRETFAQNIKFKYFTVQCNNAEYKRMDQDLSLGQLYDVHNQIQISTSNGWAYSFITTILVIE